VTNNRDPVFSDEQIVKARLADPIAMFVEVDEEIRAAGLRPPALIAQADQNCTTVRNDLLHGFGVDLNDPTTAHVVAATMAVLAAHAQGALDQGLGLPGAWKTVRGCVEGFLRAASGRA